MADKCHIYLLGLIILLTGTSGKAETGVFCSDGVNVTLPCNIAHSDCTSTTWIHYRKSNATGVELFRGGIKKNDHKRLSLGSDCSLNIYKTTKEDCGGYTCRQQVEREDPYTDANVYLHFLHVSPSSTQTEIRPDSSVTLSCHFYSFDDALCKLFTMDGFQLVWVNESDVNLNSDSRYQISYSPDHCNGTLTTTLLNEDNNREWRCQMRRGTKVKTSARYTVKYRVTLSNLPYKVFAAVAAAVAPLLALLVLWLICNKRAGKRKMVQEAQRSDMRTDPAVCDSSSSILLSPSVDVHQRTEDVAYAEIVCKKGLNERLNDQSDDGVTYVSIRGGNLDPRVSEV